MTKDEALNAIYNGNLVNCNKEEYPEIRTALQDKAGKLIDSGDPMRAMIMLEEVKRLDGIFNALEDEWI